MYPRPLVMKVFGVFSVVSETLVPGNVFKTKRRILCIRNLRCKLREEETLHVGKTVAKQANGAVLMHYGDTTVFCTATASEGRDGIDFFH